MKIDINENDYSLDITIYAETAVELAQLSRFALNAKAEKPSIYLSFSRHPKDPYLNINMAKKHELKQTNSINPFRV